MPLDGQPAGRVPAVPDSATLTGLRLRSREPLRDIFASAMACMSPLTTSGTRPFIFDNAAIRRSCCLSQPDCQYGFGMEIVSFLSGPRRSGYHSPHLPAVHPGGFDG